ncbi:MAG TPA: protein kinase [Kribbella sp.]|uniref:serine/threonine-protein kinase n=1 Tax=Kribbella sp. TaxID=1871183 RepID=UPI002D78789A|nr:protein kinase [Kribbella sp.]HET6291852.1 protein kinase [Kribbella sp.]
MEAFAGRYRLIDLIGTGGMGSVWRAWDLRREAYVAAKVLGQHDAATLLRFVREQSLRIQHPHVVAPHGWAADDDKVVFAMDLVRGGSVATLLGDHGPLPASYVAVLLDQVLHGLSAVHAAGIVHRDLKPANLLLDATGTGRPHLRVSDFGIAGLLDEPRMTRHSTVLGTPGYIAPEQLAGADPDPRQDLYTVGAVAAELLTGTRPETNGDLPAPIQSTNGNSVAGDNSMAGGNSMAKSDSAQDGSAQGGSAQGGSAAAAASGADGRLWELIRMLTAPTPTGRPDSAAEAGRLLAETGALPPPHATPWADQPDPPEVFDQLPALPPTWTPTGPATTRPAPAPRRTSEELAGRPSTSSDATPPPAHKRPGSPLTSEQLAARPSTSSDATPPPTHQRPGSARTSEAVRGRPHASSDVTSSPLHHLTGSPLTSEEVRGRPHAPSDVSPATPPAPDGARRGLVVAAVGSFVGAAGLLASAAWLLLR